MTKNRKQPKEKIKSLSKRKAAAYLRSATSYASDSPEYPAIREQAEGIHAYAAKHGIDIVKTYIDEGKSGLTAQGRDGLRSMIADIHSGAAEYTVILMRDISRWGRGQPDESAHYEFICARAGFDVYYVEPFKNNGSIDFSIHFKRALAEEYRRERAAKAKAVRLRRKARKAAEALAETEGAHE